MNATKRFTASLQTMFFVPRPASTVRDISNQFRTGFVRSVAQDVYEVEINDIPALVTMRRNTLSGLRYVRNEAC